MTTNILKLPEVIKRTGLSRSTIYLYLNNNAFPKSVQIGDRAVGWIESEIEDWLSKKISRRRS